MYRILFLGNVYHFNENGTQKDKTGWEAGMCLSLIEDGTKSCEEKEWLKVWSRYLSASLNDDAWNKERYMFCFFGLIPSVNLGVSAPFSYITAMEIKAVAGMLL